MTRKIPETYRTDMQRAMDIVDASNIHGTISYFDAADMVLKGIQIGRVLTRIQLNNAKKDGGEGE